MITTCFVLTLVIVWMPKTSGMWIRILRDINNAILTLGIFGVIIFFINFLTSGSITSIPTNTTS